MCFFKNLNFLIREIKMNEITIKVGMNNNKLHELIRNQSFIFSPPNLGRDFKYIYNLSVIKFFV